MADCLNCTEKCPQAELAHEIAKGRMYATNEIVKLVKKIESGQLVEVVRCGKCVWYDPRHIERDGERIEYADIPETDLDGGLVTMDIGVNVDGRCARHYTRNLYMKPDDFCSHGERKENA